MDVYDRIPRFKTCCLYVPLLPATLIILWFSVIISCVYIFIPVVLLFVISNSDDVEIEKFGPPTIRPPTSAYISAYLWLAIFGGITSFVITFIALFGVHRNNPAFVKPYLIWKGVTLTLEIIVALVHAYVIVLPLLAFAFYLWLVVFSYYKGMFESAIYTSPTPM